MEIDLRRDKFCLTFLDSNMEATVNDNYPSFIFLLVSLLVTPSGEETPLLQVCDSNSPNL